MLIGIPKEIKESEHRVGMTPSGVQSLIENGHTVYVQNNAGNGSGYSDKDYLSVGANILKTIEEVYDISEMIIKVKEPLKKEYSLIKEGQIIYTFFHFASSLELTNAMIKSKSICIAYETVENSDKSLPLLTPMSEVAGRMAAQQGAKFLEKHQKGCGILLGGVPGVSPAKAVVIGGGVVGTLAPVMKGCPNLNIVSLLSCKLDDESIKDTLGIKGLRLRQLHLCNLSARDNSIGVEGAEAIGSLVKDVSCSLTDLRLRKVGFNNESIKIVVNSLMGNTKLKHLSLYGNKIEMSGCDSIINLLQTPTCNIFTSGYF